MAMKDVGIVLGDAAQAVPLVIGFDTVYVHTNIVSVPEDAQGKPVSGLFQYNEIQYDKDVYIQLVLEQTRADLDYILLMGGL